MAAANSSGGVMGKMIDAQSIVVASTATNWYGHEGDILRYVFFHSIALACLVGILVSLQAYVYPFTLLVKLSCAASRLLPFRHRGGREARRRQDFMRVIFVPSKVRLAIRPAFVRTNATTGPLIVLASIWPLAPVRSTATDASAPTDQPSLLRNASSDSCVKNMKMMAFDCAPACNPIDSDARL